MIYRGFRVVGSFIWPSMRRSGAAATADNARNSPSMEDVSHATPRRHRPFTLCEFSLSIVEQDFGMRSDITDKFGRPLSQKGKESNRPPSKAMRNTGLC